VVKEAVSRRRDWLIQDSRSLPADAASRALRGDVEGFTAAQDRSPGPLAAEIASLFERARSWPRGGSEVVALELKAIAAVGEMRLNHGAVGEAVAVLATLGVGICAGYEKIWDEESEVGLVIDRCVEGLEACLDRAEASTRGDILGALLDIAVWERTSGGYGVGERAAELILARSTVDEKRAIAAAAASVLQRAVLRAYNRQRLGSFVVQLSGGAEAERAALLQEKGDQRRRILRLLALHEPKEAARVLAELDEPGELTGCAELFIEHGYPDEGHKVVEAAATRGKPDRLQVLTWLYGQAIHEADDKAAATWAEEIFREAPTVEHWGLLRASARGTLRHQLRHELLDAGEHLLLIEILLSENKAREALSKFRAVKARTPRVLAAMRQIADGVVAKRPRDAARLYAEIADAHVTDDHETAVDLIFRGYQAFMAAGHPVLATRHLADFCRRHAGRDELIGRIEQHSAAPRMQSGEHKTKHG
jgi:hypothetical protein